MGKQADKLRRRAGFASGALGIGGSLIGQAPYRVWVLLRAILSAGEGAAVGMGVGATYMNGIDLWEEKGREYCDKMGEWCNNGQPDPRPSLVIGHARNGKMEIKIATDPWPAE
jgi:hypothetical protein